MKKCVIPYKDVIDLPPKKRREYVYAKLTGAGFDMNKSITVTPDPEKQESLYQQK